MKPLFSDRRPRRRVHLVAVAVLLTWLPLLAACSATTEVLVSVNAASELQADGLPVPTPSDVFLPSTEGFTLADLALPAEPGVELTELGFEVVGAATYRYATIEGLGDATVTIALEVRDGSGATEIAGSSFDLPPDTSTPVAFELRPSDADRQLAESVLRSGGAVRVRIETSGSPGDVELTLAEATITVGVRPGNLLF